MEFNYTNMNPKNYPIRKKNESAKLFSVMVKKRHIFFNFCNMQAIFLIYLSFLPNPLPEICNPGKLYSMGTFKIKS